MSGADRKLLGRWGEAMAAQELRRRGWKIIGAGWQCRHGEIDLIATNRKYISFTEVKLRKNANYGQAREFVDRHKQQRLIISAQLYLSEHPTKLQPRFDVMEIYAPEGVNTQNPAYTFIENAFEVVK